ncbi:MULTISPECIES: 23S rRNA (adenine(1618)-N(6))-methyltransferase RlmF [unclassified Kaistella]|uniref:23S rRNA (adenine(1618)-N(6))-methyltransferase RlmF n=1 Tax=unclassified Kaistella TaxID=2762626 RepID=UPI002732C834|nr:MULTISPECIES: 23S rRNA (adenine(1618)-N(6))-methyltransferase RlmF [unclassified Kaistella]MDP2453169.1 23S rRNA (adenine(1618)-N(6))-methyltransferase RlmF [Kaistella sp. SH11-4b]MDP2456226.1 23S rRNA (adenine(1618)-N(6))-methyltransferase RlmF [Kaistella sp. SH40-3]MDP2458982.1 23S rRNA (adenine(1618)-N(6))-methyltransferase RlmF [Kaistella sp. SH19-2b]
MSAEKNIQEKVRLHIRNKNRERYDLDALKIAVPELADHITTNKYGAESVDFANPVAVKLLNKALLNHYYGIKNWDFPEDNLVPPIPGRADYLHYMADLLGQSNFGDLPEGDKITVLDIGVGASCIYPIIGAAEYGWNFIGSDINEDSVESARNIVNSNSNLEGKIDIRLQENSTSLFKGILNTDEKIDFSMSNPPFHSSPEEAQKGSRRKVKNLSGKKIVKVELNFAGISNELIYEGGESKFIHSMIIESQDFAKNCFWFTTLVSKQSNLKGIYKTLNELEVAQVKTIPIGTGNKSSRIIAWSFLSKEEQKEWRETRWRTAEEKPESISE